MCSYWGNLLCILGGLHLQFEWLMQHKFDVQVISYASSMVARDLLEAN